MLRKLLAVLTLLTVLMGLAGLRDGVIGRRVRFPWVDAIRTAI